MTKNLEPIQNVAATLPNKTKTRLNKPVRLTLVLYMLAWLYL